MSNISILESYGRVSFMWNSATFSFKCTWYNDRITRDGYGYNHEWAAKKVVNSLRYMMDKYVREAEASRANR